MQLLAAAVHKAAEPTWEHRQRVAQKRQPVCPEDQGSPAYFSNTQLHRVAYACEEVVYLYHNPCSHIKAFSFVGQSAPHLARK